jgi:hypothetical protein
VVSFDVAVAVPIPPPVLADHDPGAIRETPKSAPERFLTMARNGSLDNVYSAAT